MAGAGVPSCVEPGWCISFVTSHVEMHMYFCIFVNIASLIVQQCRSTCTRTSASDQCNLDNLVIQMRSSKEAWIRASECTLRLHVFSMF